MTKLIFKIGGYEHQEEEISFLLTSEKVNRFKITFDPKSLEGEGEKKTGVFLPLDLAGDVAKKSIPNPNQWLTNANIAFILKHKEFIDKEAKLKRSITKDENVLWGRDFQTRTDLENIGLINQLAKWKHEKRALDETQEQQLGAFKRDFENGIAKYTTFPIELGEHPGNHWGMLVLWKASGEAKEKGSNYRAFWASSLLSNLEEVKQIKPLVVHLTNEKVADKISILQGEKQINSEDCGVYLCLYIKDIIEYKTRQDGTISTPLTLNRKYNKDGINKYRQLWKKWTEDETGIGTWCQRNTPIKKKLTIKRAVEGKHVLKFKPLSLDGAENIKTWLEEEKKELDKEWLKKYGMFIETEGLNFEGYQAEEGLIIDKSKCQNKGGWDKIKDLILKNKEWELSTNEVIWAAKQERDGDYSDALVMIKPRSYLIISEDFSIELSETEEITYEEEKPLTPFLPKTTQYDDLLKNAWVSGWEVELEGDWVDYPDSPSWESWLIATSPYIIHISPPLVEKPIIKSKGAIIELSKHICPYIELPKVEENFKKQFERRIKDLEKSESDLMDVRSDLHAKLNEANRNIEDICERWGKVENLAGLNKRIEELTRERNSFEMKFNHSEEQVRRLKTEMAERDDTLQKNRNREVIVFKLLVGKELEEGHSMKNEWLEGVLNGQTLTQIVEERNKKTQTIRDFEEAIKQLCTKYAVENLEELQESFNKTLKDFSEEKNWWNKWMSEPDDLTFTVERNLTRNATFTLETTQIFGKKGKFSYELKESGDRKLGRQNFKAIYEKYRGMQTADDEGIDKLEEEIIKLIGTNFTPEQVMELRDLFVDNGLIQTYNFIQEVTSLTNNHKIRELEKFTEDNKQRLKEYTNEELVQIKQEVGFLLENSSLVHTREFVEGIIEIWILLLENELEEEDDETERERERERKLV